MHKFVLALGLALAAAPLAAEGLRFEPVAPEGIGADRVANVEKFQASFGDPQLASMQAQGYGAYGAIAIPVAKPGNPATVANFKTAEEAKTAALAACKTQTEVECTIIGLFVPAK